VLKGNVAVVALAGLMFGSTGALAQGRVPTEVARQQIQIVIMENVLKEAVRTGGRDLVNQLTDVVFLDANSVEGMLEGPPEVQGVKVAPHGIVFFVRVPRMNAMASLLPDLARNPQWRVNPVRPAGQSQAGRPQAQVTAASIDPTEVLSDPATAYRRAVTDSLINAILDNGGTLQVKRNEYVTVAARRNAPANPLNLKDDVRTLTITVSGAVLEDLQQKALMRDEARKRVTVEEN
jgi:hypothetical protein